MQSIEKKAIQTYQNNISYLSKTFPELFKKVALLDAAIETGQYIEKYALEYREGYFDILDIQNNQFMYGQNSDKISKKMAKKSNHKKNESVIESFYQSYSNISKEAAQQINDNVILHDNALLATSKILYYTRVNAPKETTTIMHIFKYIFFGVGTGKHLELIKRKFRFKQVFIVEKNLELFRLSLFTLNYAEIFKDVKVFFSIAENINDFSITFNNFFRKGFSHNHFLKYSLFSQDYLPHIKEIQNTIVTSDYIAFPYSKKLVISLKAPYYLVHKYNFLNISKQLENSPFSKKPVIVVAAGPSFGNNIEWLKKNQHKFTIITILASLKILNQHNIKPDIVVNLDASENMLKFLKDIDIDSFLSKTLFIFASMSHKHTTDVFPKDNLFLYDSMSKHKKGFGQAGAASVGELTYSLALTLGATEIYLLGLDLALDPETNLRYADKDHKKNTMEEEKSVHSTQLEKTFLEVEGNFVKTVSTLPIFQMSINAFREISKSRKAANQSVYNLCNGAKLDGSTPLKIEDIDTKEMPDIKKDLAYTKELKNFFNHNSEDYATKKDIDFFDSLIKEGKKLLDILKSYKEEEIYSTIDDNMIGLGRLIDTLQAKGREDLFEIHLIMLKYNQFLTSYIIAFFNTNEIKNPIEHFKNIREIYIQQSEKIINIYTNTMEHYKTIAEYELLKNEKAKEKNSLT